MAKFGVSQKSVLVELFLNMPNARPEDDIILKRCNGGSLGEFRVQHLIQRMSQLELVCSVGAD